jgi:phosphatidate phosphatase PAH1
MKTVCLGVLCGLAMLVTTPVNAVTCPDYESALNPPAFDAPSRRGFRHWGNNWLTWLYRPWHMVHDAIVPVGTSATVVGKFDYDAVLHKDLEDENIKVYITGTGMAGWQYLGRYRTNSDGKISVNAGARPVGEYRVRMVVEGDLSHADGYLSVVEPGRQAVLFDIDGTLTTNDFEAAADYLGIKTASTYSYATETVQAYKDRGYQVIYLTGAPYWVTRDRREWFDRIGLQDYHYHSNPYGGGPIPPDTQGYKTDYLNYLLADVGLDIVRAYGNADTDIAAYAAAGLPKAETWIIGENAGADGTQALNGSYYTHFYNVVANTAPALGCQ